MYQEVRVLAKLAIEPEQIEKVVNAFKLLMNETRKESGCLQYDLHQEVHDPATLIIFERWKTEAAFEGHLKTLHFSSCFNKVSELIKYNETRILKKI
ncbi:antibiotic biosynthesis monooxygenase [Acinetobacter baumannii]|uniref:putative quinol monooxygenase n=1 Tax=Acinetobacter baumannii TaxID=470 RepID=UPI000446E511|nr:putative quinol monooxygenase [Acinetobacter baumannii]EXA62256.1 antibiotic biosynthesis monooxygenase family protein [Acinetobacter baumannii 1035119]MDC4616904.1 antibiotic biosynthesis monooxygenase [Acinetobacter baumannii]MDC4760902.1 antibiotic biosynthesis monooxygenase [Acinetobacter baumannii]MDC5083212.1 antibiotic biosynthesis monooxygenase [Acinetobacter baumannii]MDV7495047.1 putative quinol monooxygenase [Acinetobacter baumannii]